MGLLGSCLGMALLLGLLMILDAEDIDMFIVIGPSCVLGSTAGVFAATIGHVLWRVPSATKEAIIQLALERDESDA